MKALLIGCGGIGSYLAEKLHELLLKKQIPSSVEIDLADDDTVEMEQILWQNFIADDAGNNKAACLAERYRSLVCNPAGRIKSEEQLEGYDFFFVCVDNDVTRDMVIRHGFRKNKEFLDIRCHGSRVFAVPKLKELQENLKFVDWNDKGEYSCQDKADLEKGRIQLGNEYIAVRGAQMFLNHLRGYANFPYLDLI